MYTAFHLFLALAIGFLDGAILVTKHTMTACWRYKGDAKYISLSFHGRSHFYTCTLIVRHSTFLDMKVSEWVNDSLYYVLLKSKNLITKDIQSKVSSNLIVCIPMCPSLMSPKIMQRICDWICKKGSYTYNYKYLEI